VHTLLLYQETGRRDRKKTNEGQTSLTHHEGTAQCPMNVFPFDVLKVETELVLGARQGLPLNYRASCGPRE
jgi:hypothetical protein